jgi:ubiquinone/menaquinone biosynthesis C-methylase UbiE
MSHKSSFQKTRSAQQAEDYIDIRFNKSRRMQQLDRMERLFAQSLADRLDTGSTILDIPSGNGRFTSILSSGGDVINMDYDANMLLALKAKDAEPGLHVQGDITAIPMPTDSIDLAFCMRLFHHVGERSMRLQSLAELARVSRRYVAVSFYKKESWRYIKKRIRGKKVAGHPVRYREFIADAAQHNLRPIETIPRGFSVSPQTLVLFEKIED